MQVQEFVQRYEAALGTQEWRAVSPLIHEDASVVFSSGAVHKGKDAVQAAYENNFQAINNEKYEIANVHWLFQFEDSAAYMFDFFWTGSIGGQEVSGAGRGTAVLIRADGDWQLIAEHLGPYPQ